MHCVLPACRHNWRLSAFAGVLRNGSMSTAKLHPRMGQGRSQWLRWHEHFASQGSRRASKVCGDLFSLLRQEATPRDSHDESSPSSSMHGPIQSVVFLLCGRLCHLPSGSLSNIMQPSDSGLLPEQLTFLGTARSRHASATHPVQVNLHSFTSMRLVGQLYHLAWGGASRPRS